MMTIFSSLLLLCIIISSSTSTSVSAQNNGLVTGCSPGFFPPWDQSRVCDQPLCGSPEAPFLCQYPAQSGKQFICLTYDQVFNSGHEPCLGGCLDLRMCGTNKCEDQCSMEQCEATLKNGTICPPTTGPNADPRNMYVCTAGKIKNFCGVNQNCNDGSKCLLLNPSCQSCCNFANSCPQYETCRGKKCSQSVCDARNVCAWELPFICNSGSLRNGCSSDPHWFPRHQCTDCCDLTTCYPLTCGICPPEMCQEGQQIPISCAGDSYGPAICQNASANAPQNQNVCKPYGYWSTHQGCDKCCTCQQ